MNYRLPDIPSITFFFPYHDVSGVPVLFLRMSEYIANTYHIQTFVVDYVDGYMSRSIKNDSPVRVRYFEDGVPMEIPSDTILVFQSLIPFSIPTELKINPQTRVIFWTFVPFNLAPLHILHALQLRYATLHKCVLSTLMLPLKRKLQRLVRRLDEKRSLFFYDGPVTKETIDRLGVKIAEPIIIPIPCDVDFKEEKQRVISNKRTPISFCWLGRYCDWKIHILLYSIRKLSEYALAKHAPIKMHIIGHGPELTTINSSNFENDYFSLVSVGVLDGQLLYEYLDDNVDVLMAMGTSALEGAQLSIPTILLDFSFAPIRGHYRFKWLFEAKDYTLGEVIRNHHFSDKDDSIEGIMEEIMNDYASIANKTYAYCHRNHSISSVCEKFVNALTHASFRYCDFDRDILEKGHFTKGYESAYNLYHSAKAKRLGDERRK